MNEPAKTKAKLFLKRHSMKVVDYSSLSEAAEKLGYTIVGFHNACNDEDVSVVINELGLQNAILHSKGFTYADSNYRLIFVNEDLNENEKIMVMSHELGHIECGHITEKSVFGDDVRQECEANEFSLYLLNHTKEKMSFFRRNKKLLIALASLSVAILVLFLLFLHYRNKSADVLNYSEYYITATGDKYHVKNCGYVKNKSDAKAFSKEAFESGKYSPCTKCIPQEAE